MPVRYLEPRRPDESLEQYQARVDAHEEQVEQDGEEQRRIMERIDSMTMGKKRR